VGDAGFGFPGSSKDNFNFIGFYEEELYSVRLAYTYRGSFFRSLAGTGSQATTARFSGAQEKLNVNVNIKPMKGLSIKLSANNITGEKRRDFIGNETTFLDYFDRGRTYSISANYRF
jgi:outer membrane receptor protein involved in Fe transport